MVTGGSNTINENDVFGNSLLGLKVTGSMNLVYKNDVGDGGKGNTGDGINVNGNGNVIDENNVFANGKKVGTTYSGDGIEVSGGTTAAPNLVTNNDVGDRGKGNFGNGIVVGGAAADAANGTTAPVEISGNTVMSNGLNGIWVNTGGAGATTGHQLSNNVSGGTGTYAGGGQDNGKCEFLVVAGNFNAGGNKANGTTIPGAVNSAFPTACQGTP